MTEIIQDGAGNVAPKRNKRGVLTMLSPKSKSGRNSQNFSTGMNSTQNLAHSRMLSQGTITTTERRFKPFKRQDWDNEPGANLVINRRSLNKEANRKV
jgi:hypothetical protein